MALIVADIEGERNTLFGTEKVEPFESGGWRDTFKNSLAHRAPDLAANVTNVSRIGHRSDPMDLRGGEITVDGPAVVIQVDQPKITQEELRAVGKALRSALALNNATVELAVVGEFS